MNDRMKYFLGVLFLLSLKAFSQKADSITSISMYGKWRVTDLKSLLLVNMDHQDSSFIEEMQDYEKQCRESIITFEKDKFYIQPKNACGFIPCDSLRLSEIKEMPKLTDTSLYYKYDGAEIVQYHMVSQGFLNLIKSKENKLRYIDTNCLCDNGDYTLKIILLDNNRIVLFSGVDVTMLSRVCNKGKH